MCTTELGAFAKLEPEFTRRNVKLIGLSANTVESHGGWIKDIDEISGSHVRFPIIGDKDRQVAYRYDMYVTDASTSPSTTRTIKLTFGQDRSSRYDQRRSERYRLHYSIRLHHRSQEDYSPHHVLSGLDRS